ncbi:hypothetical protein BVY04_01620 [bacterium M21]|nr:hypothetical protein BVY04_01620 [bacterium M21]
MVHRLSSHIDGVEMLNWVLLIKREENPKKKTPELLSAKVSAFLTGHDSTYFVFMPFPGSRQEKGM